MKLDLDKLKETKIKVYLPEDDKSGRKEGIFNIVDKKGNVISFGKNKSEKGEDGETPKEYNFDPDDTIELPMSALDNIDVVLSNSADVAAVESMVSTGKIDEILKEDVDFVEVIDEHNFPLSGIMYEVLKWSVSSDTPLKLNVKKVIDRLRKNESISKKAVLGALGNIRLWYEFKSPELSKWASQVWEGLCQ